MPYDCRAPTGRGEHYCISDADILKKSMEIYIRDGIEIDNRNPLDCTTIASYATKVYCINYLQDNKAKDGERR